MKKAITAGLLSILFLLTSCMKENHSIRLKNDSNFQITNSKVGDESLGDVASGSSSDYKSVHTGNFSFSGDLSTGQTMSGGGSISGLGKHKWTILVSGSGQVTFAEDK